MTATPPPPLEWHPWYRDKTWLMDWLDSTDYAVEIQVKPPIRAALTADIPQRVRLTKQKAQGPAPYVGRPFVYGWSTATDNLGRSIASDARVVYLEEWPT